MGHHISWDNEYKTVVLQQYTENAGKDDLYRLAQKSAQMLNTVNHRVHLIIDERNIDLTLTGTDMRYLQRLTPKNQGAVVMVVTEKNLQYKTRVQAIGRQLAPDAFADPYFALSIDEAREFIATHFDMTLLEE